MKDLMADASVDKSFKAHSVWGASTSAAMAKGVSLAEILSTVNWSKESTFRQYCYRQTKSTDYVLKVLQTGTDRPQ